MADEPKADKPMADKTKANKQNFGYAASLTKRLKVFLTQKGSREGGALCRGRRDREPRALVPRIVETLLKWMCPFSVQSRARAVKLRYRRAIFYTPLRK